MPLHPQTAAIVEGMAEANAGRPEMHEQSVEEARLGYQALASAFGPGPEVADVTNRTIPGPAGEIPVRCYTPAGDGPFPVLVFFHGGGWVIGDLETHDRECRMLCNDAGVLVVAIDYRLAPEHPYPACHEDCWAATQWVAANAAALGGDASRIAVGGDSAGGNLSASIALSARDAGLELRLQMLIYPATDLRGHDPDYEGQAFASLAENREGPFLTLDSIRYFSGHHRGAAAHQAIASEPRLSPLLAQSHRGLAPAFVATCELDPLRDEGNAYAARLVEAGVPVQFKQWAGQPHVLFQLSPVLDDGKALLAECADALRRAMV